MEVELPWVLEPASPEDADAAVEDDASDDDGGTAEDDAGNEEGASEEEEEEEEDDDAASEAADEEDVDAPSEDAEVAALLESEDAPVLEDDGSRLLEDSTAELDSAAELLNPPLLEPPATAVRRTQMPRASQVFSGRQSRSRVHVGSPGQAHSKGSAANSTVTSRACFAMFECIRPSRVRQRDA